MGPVCQEQPIVDNAKSRKNGMNEQNLPIYIDSYYLTKEIALITLRFPKEYKFTWGSSLNNDAVSLCCQILKVNRSSQKTYEIKNFLLLLERVRVQLRLCSDCHILSHRQQARFAEMLENIEAQALGWQKSEQQKERRKNKQIKKNSDSGRSPENITSCPE